VNSEVRITRGPATKFITQQQDDYFDFTKHLVLIDTTAWVKALATDTSYLYADIFAQYVASAPTQLANKFANMSFVRCGIKLTVMLEGCAYACGWLRYSFDPNVASEQVSIAGRYGMPSPGNVRGLLLPGIDIVPGESTTYELDLPCPTPSGYYTLRPNTINNNALGSWGMTRNVMSQLLTGTAVTPSCTVRTYMSLIKPEFIGLTLTMNEEKTEHKYSGPLAQVSEISSMVSTYFPPLAAFTTPFSIVTGAASAILAVFGFSKPSQPSSFFRIAGTTGNYSHVDGKIDAYVVSASCQNALSIADEMCPLLRKEDMVVDDLISRKTVIITIPIATTDGNGTVYPGIPVHPQYNDPTVTSHGGQEYTPMQWIAATADYWAGDITYNFKFICSVFHRATVGIYYDCGKKYNLAAITLAQAQATLPGVIVNISGDTEQEFTVPWKNQMAMLPTNMGFPNTTFTSTTGYNCNGFVYLFLINAVSTNGSTDPINCVVLAHSKDMKFIGLSQNHIIQPTLAFASQPVVQLTGTELKSEFKCGASAKHSELALGMYGEYPHVTTKQIASRLSVCFELNSPVTANLYQNVSAQAPDGFVLHNNNIGSGTTQDITNLASWMAMAYLGARGGKVFTFNPGMDAQINTRGLVRASRFPAGSLTPTIVLSNVQPTTGALSNSAYAIVDGSVSPIAEFILPSYYNGYFRPVYPMATSNTGGTAIPGPCVGYTQLDAVLPSGSPITHIDLLVSEAIADDAQFVFFRGPPPVVYTGTTA
jgi:hypothetical protein